MKYCNNYIKFTKILMFFYNILSKNWHKFLNKNSFFYKLRI